MFTDYCDWPFAKQPQPAAAPLVERRMTSRQCYPIMQRIVSQATEADKTRVDRVRFHDLSSAGVSFWDSNPPESEHLVVELGEGASRQPLLVEVRHRTRVSCWQSPLYLIGCRVVQRISLDDATAAGSE